MTKNSPALWQRRRSSRVTDRAPRMAGAVEPTGATPSMLRDVPDRRCADCGYTVCAPNCADGYPSTAAWFAKAVPALEHAQRLADAGIAKLSRLSAEAVVPRGWAQREANWWQLAGSTTPVGRDALAVCTASTGAFRGWREDNGWKDFTSLYPAMLFALGCTMSEAGGTAGGWFVGKPSGYRSWYADADLPALVERLTAERAKPEPVSTPYELPAAHEFPHTWLPADELAPGWSAVLDSRQQLDHVTGASVWLGYDERWCYDLSDCEERKYQHDQDANADGYAPTRDEAMALALGWYEDPDYRCGGTSGAWFFNNPNGSRQQIVSVDCAWRAYRNVPDWAEHVGAPSLPHAIAWCRGDERPRCLPTCGSICHTDCPTLRETR